MPPVVPEDHIGVDPIPDNKGVSSEETAYPTIDGDLGGGRVGGRRAAIGVRCRRGLCGFPGIVGCSARRNSEAEDQEGSTQKDEQACHTSFSPRAATS